MPADDRPPAERRDAVDGPDADDRSDPILVAAIRDEILRHGPITFARFMERALYEPGHGYYVAAQPRPGRSGDFLTAPEAHWLFGRTVARQVAECWQRLGAPRPFTVREYGSGSGALAGPMLAGLRDEFPDALAATRYEPVETNEHRLAELRARLAREGLDGPLSRPERAQPERAQPELSRPERARRPAVPAPPRRAPAQGRAGHGRFTGVVLANEFVDAMPVHRVERRDGRLVEIGVGWRDGAFVDEPMPPSTPDLEAYLARVGATLAEGQRTEVNLGIRPWLAHVAAEMARGWVFVIDYGMQASELHSRRRARGTLKAVAGQRVAADPYADVGRQDLTAHVDLTELDLAARDAGFQVVGRTAQGRFLVALDLGSLLVDAQSHARSVNEALETRSAAMWLLDPRRTGGFAVSVFGRDAPVEPRLRGLAEPASDPGRGMAPG